MKICRKYFWLLKSIVTCDIEMKPIKYTNTNSVEHCSQIAKASVGVNPNTTSIEALTVWLVHNIFDMRIKFHVTVKGHTQYLHCLTWNDSVPSFIWVLTSWPKNTIRSWIGWLQYTVLPGILGDFLYTFLLLLGLPLSDSVMATYVSSAYTMTSLPLRRSLTWLIYMLKSFGPKTDPCTHPRVNGISGPLLPLTSTVIVLSVRKSLVMRSRPSSSWPRICRG